MACGLGHGRRTALHIAARVGHTDVISILLAAGADESLKDESGYGV
jgi:ankyrin repeat protein